MATISLLSRALPLCHPGFASPLIRKQQQHSRNLPTVSGLGFQSGIVRGISSGSSENDSSKLRAEFLGRPKLETPRNLSRFVPFASASPASEEEVVIFEGGPHFGDLLFNLLLGFTFLWLPLTLASVFRNLFLRYRLTNRRVTITSGLSESERRDFPYSAIVDVKSVPRLVGEWGDIAITLSDKTIVEFKSVPSFREIAKYCLEKSQQEKGEDTKKSVEQKGF